MKLALIKGGAVVNTVLEGGTFSLPSGDRVSPAVAGWSSEDGYKLVPYVEETTGTGPIVSDWVDTVEADRVLRARKARERTAEEARAAMPPLTPRQFRLGLVRNGMTPGQVTQALNSLPQPAKAEAEVEWEYATEFRRNHPFIATLMPSLGLTDEQVDTMWAAAKEY